MEEDNLPHPLPHRLVEVMLVIGFDEDTGLPTLPSKEPEIDKSLDNIFKNDYEPCVLAAVSSSTMVYFYPFIRKDETYPPSSTHTPTRAMHSLYSSTQIMSLPESSVSGKIHRFGKSFDPTHLRSVSVNPKIISRQLTMRGQVGVVPNSRFLMRSSDLLLHFVFQMEPKCILRSQRTVSIFLCLLTCLGSNPTPVVSPSTDHS